jgi:bla regulator protein BlaR1
MNGFMSLVGMVSEWSEHALELAVFAGLYAGFLAIVVLAINVLGRRWLSARQMGLLWGLVLLRLLIPVAPSSTFSLETLARFVHTEMNRPTAAADLQADTEQSDGRQSESAPAVVAVGAEASQSSEGSPSTDVPSTAGPLGVDFSAAIDTVLFWLPTAWLFGAIAYVVWTALADWRFRRRLNRVLACDDPRLLALWQACCDQAGRRRRIPIVQFDGISQPAVSGLFHPRLLLPESAAIELSDAQLRMVMLHELAHVRRGHVAANWLLVVLRAVHWWNPVYWLAAARFQNLREQACDAFALRAMHGDSVRAYSELLLTLSERRPPRWRVLLPTSLLGFFSSVVRKRAIRNRLRALRSAATTRSRWHTAGVSLLIVSLALCGLTNASDPAPPTDESSDWMARSARGGDWQSAPESDGGGGDAADAAPLETRTYDIAKLLKRLAIAAKTESNARLELKSMLEFMVKPPNVPLVVAKEGATPSFALQADRLTVTTTAARQAEIALSLKLWEQTGLSQICVGIQFIESERDLAATLGIPTRDLQAVSTTAEEGPPAELRTGPPLVRASASVDDYLPVVTATLTEEQSKTLTRAANADTHANSAWGPKLTLFNGQKGTLFSGTLRPFVVGLKTNAPGTPKPITIFIEEGLKFTIRATERDDTKQVQLASRLTWSTITEVESFLPHVANQPTRIEIPRVKRRRIEAISNLPAGNSLLITFLPAFEQKKFVYVLLSVHAVIPAE